MSILIASPGLPTAQVSRWEWAKIMTGTNIESGESIAIDKNGNIYTLGTFRDTVDFDPGPGTYYRASKGITDLFISKLDSTGQFVWVKTIGGDDMDIGKSIAVDAFENIYILGEFHSICDFDPGPQIFYLESSGNKDVFVCKLNSAGQFKWATSIGGFEIDAGEDISTDASGNLIVTGSFTGTCSFGADGGSFTSASKGYSDIFISKLDSLGSFQWVKIIGGEYADQGNSVAVDDFGNVYTTGDFTNTVDFDPGPGIFRLGDNHDYYSTVFISKLDQSGNFIWAKGLTASAWSTATSIALDTLGSTYITGNFRRDQWGGSLLDFDPGAGNFTINASYDESIFILKLSSTGDFRWAEKVGAQGLDSGNAIAVDPTGNVYITGVYSGNLEFDLVTHQFLLNADGGTGTDILIFKMDSEGRFMWAAGAGGTYSDYGSSIAIDAAGYAYVTGGFESRNLKIDTFTPLNYAKAGKPDAFIIKVNNAEENCLINVTHHVTDVLCKGEASGSISLNILHGVDPINYLWSNGDTTATITSLQAGNYAVTFSDAASCVGSFSFTISEPPQMEIEIITIHPASPSGSGRIWISVTGGLGGYAYHWIDPLGEELFIEDLNNLTVSGYYTLTVTDANGCQNTIDSIFVDHVTATHPFPEYPTLKIYPVPAKDQVYLDTNLTITEVLIYTMDGRLSKHFVRPVSNSLDIFDLGPGWYCLRITDGSNWYNVKMVK